jgi:hypothetical protein
MLLDTGASEGTTVEMPDSEHTLFARNINLGWFC